MIEFRARRGEPFSSSWGRKAIRVLIVDDRDAFAGFLRVVAAGCGYEPRILQVRETFEDVVSDWKPDIIALDIVMPERDGIELIGALAKLNFPGQLILVSGADELYLTMAARTARDHGLAVSASLRKPCRAEELRQELRLAAALVLAKRGKADE